MKKIGKFLAVIVALLMMTTMLPFTVFAVNDGYVAQVGGTKYTTFNEAWEKVKNGGTITLLDDCEVMKSFKTDENSNVTVEIGSYVFKGGFEAASGATLTIKGDGKTEHKGYITPVKFGNDAFDGLFNNNFVGSFHFKEMSDDEPVSVYGGLLLGGYEEESANDKAFVSNGGKVILDGVTVAGFESISTVDNSGSLIMKNNAAIAYNSDRAVELKNNSKMEMDSTSSVHHNYTPVAVQSSKLIYGGIGLYDSSLVGGTVYNNLGSTGGGIYVQNSTIKNVTVKDNIAYLGGGLHIRYSGKAENCTFTGNTATSEGGGVYSEGGELISCTVKGNRAISGGGVFVTGANVKLGGTMTVTDNTTLTEKTNNLHLFGTGNFYIDRASEALSTDSKIGVTSAASEQRITNYHSEDENEIYALKNIFFADNGKGSISMEDDGFWFWDYDWDLYVSNAGKASVFSKTDSTILIVGSVVLVAGLVTAIVLVSKKKKSKAD